MKKKILLVFIMILVTSTVVAYPLIKPGAEQPDLYLPLLTDKKVGVFVNQSSLVGKTHLIDFLLKQHIHITKIFVPEHGFLGKAADGDTIKNSIDVKTGIPIISLYGKKVKPDAKDLKDVDVLLFDIQDVGVSFYTYISSLQRLMEAAIENTIPLIILDRPNPNGFYVDGPVNDTKKVSFTGLQPIPVVHGMTIGEYAKMLVGELWLDVKPKGRANDLQLTIIPNKYYTHQSLYIPPVPPSPNLPNIQSIYWYPSLGLMEGTVLSVGRGTDEPLQIFGHPRFRSKFTFIPTSRAGAENPAYKNQICHGWDMRGAKEQILKKINNKLQIKYIMMAYADFPDKNHFFPGSNKKPGPNNLGAQIRSGMSEKKIRESWEPKLSEFKKIRKKYLLYPDKG